MVISGGGFGIGRGKLKAELGFWVTKVGEAGGRVCLSCSGAAACSDVTPARDLRAVTSHRACDLSPGSSRNRDEFNKLQTIYQ